MIKGIKVFDPLTNTWSTGSVLYPGQKGVENGH